MKPGPLDLPTIWRGCDWGPVVLKWKDQNGDPIDVTYWQAVAQSLNINLNPSVTDGMGGVTQLSLTKVQTAKLKLGVEPWDWIWQRPAGEYRFPPFLSGKVEIKQPTSKTQGSLPPPTPIPPDVPVATAATAITSDSFTANWEAVDRATGYRLDVSHAPDFSSYVTGYQDRDVGNATSFVVSGLTDQTLTYHYRVRAYNPGGTTNSSNVIHVTILSPGQPVNDNIAQVIILTGLAGQIAGTTVGATVEAGEPAGENSVWYSWHSTINSVMRFRLSTVVNRISIFRYDPQNPNPGWGQFEHVADSVIDAGTPLVTFLAETGTWYVIRVFKSTGTAPFNLSWDYGQ